MNIYRKLFKKDNDMVSCDFSILVPSWKLNSSGYSSELYNQAIDYAESKGYYSFYKIVDMDYLEEYQQFIKTTRQEYLIIIEEIVPKNEKPINVIFWDWLFLSTSYDKIICVIYHILPQEFRHV